MAEQRVKDYKDYQGPTSREYTLKLDLSSDDTTSQKLYLDFLSQRSISISAQLISATGTSGDILVKHSPTRGGKGFDFSTPITLTTANNDTVNKLTIEQMSRYLFVDLRGITWGSQGQFILTVTGKPH